MRGLDTRATVIGESGIDVDDVTTRFEIGKTVIRCLRFPGETSSSEGSASQVITNTALVRQRTTGKKFPADITSDDGAEQATRVIIATKRISRSNG